ncbi:tetratricopeptide repeat protein [Flexithrix dorotheae]|uniref:tetratricopeptide repeat protein n=1 Tax=Flexithrix dorotheae TaxID=70993 RepID=UPI00036728A9|nr:tetratricopeptide repeat protein [Flexithrix dorotheae]
MRIVLFCLLLTSAKVFGIDPGELARINRYKSYAQEAYENENYADAIASYNFLIDSLGVDDPKIRLNIAHCYYRMGDMTNAASNYSYLDEANDKKIASIANQQLGLIKAKNKKYENALENFKEAIKNNPANEDARKGYEVVKKLLEDQKKNEEQQDKNKQEKQKDQQQQDQQQNQDQQNQQDQEQNKDQENQQDQQNKDKEEKDKEQTDEQNMDKPQDSKNTEEKQSDPKEQKMEQQMSEIDKERAEMILRAMEEQEKQYYQQLKKKSKNQLPKSNKPDW